MNVILATDSYKLTHWQQYPPNTEGVYSYFESRDGAAFPYTVFFGLQSILSSLVGRVVTLVDIDEAEELALAHFGRPLFNREGWEYVVHACGGCLPLRIKAVPEGSVIPTGNVLMTVENTDPRCFWLTNAVESLLTHVWYPSTVATLSRTTKEAICGHLRATADSVEGLPFMLHDFGYRGATSHESAAIGGCAHLVNFQGTDTLPAMLLARDDYGASLDTLAFSVPATEHSVMTSLGRDGEMGIAQRMIQENPTGIISVVADSYNIYDFVKTIGENNLFHKAITERDGVFVVRPDSVTSTHPYPSDLVAWILGSLWTGFGGTTNGKGFKVLDPHVRVLWGDGLDQHAIKSILARAQLEGFSAENLVFGMGGGLLQKVNRDTQRFAFKSSAQKRGGVWFDVWKDPVDSSKRSKRGRLRLLHDASGYATWTEHMGFKDWTDEDERENLDVLRIVFENGRLVNPITFDEVRRNAAL